MCGMCADVRPRMHIILPRTSSCSSHQPVAHIILRCTSTPMRTSSCCAHHPRAHIVLLRTSSCGARRPAAHCLVLVKLKKKKLSVRLPRVDDIFRSSSECWIADWEEAFTQQTLSHVMVGKAQGQA
ncbi:unnamed protein product [Pleuronectes platessa]|uniref:Uncharacterized protein n=1 Tax=Pleuronectes platessa TaxID=8262 RepID=A0A9N7VLU8_PLEPL|nr:unnamed protein product [Pleuronectes platessa]